MGIVENTYAELKQQELKNNPYSCLHMADIDINPHQVEAFTFALSSLELGGAILADEVGLGKTIEAGLAIKYLLCSGKNKILLIMPSNLRKQWQVELEEKFDIDSLIVDSSNWEDYLEEVKSKQAVIIVSYHFASKRKTEFGKIAWDFCVFDEAHRLRNVYKNGSKMANSLYELTKGIPKILLTATPMQNTLLDIYGLVQFIDDRVFYSKQIFSERYLRGEDYNDLKACLEPVVQRTLRKEVAEYIQFSERKEMTIDFELSPMEIELYVMINNYLKKEILYALPNSHRTLITSVIRKLLASSSMAVAETFKVLKGRLETLKETTRTESADESIDFYINWGKYYAEQVQGEVIDENLEEDAENKKKKKHTIYIREQMNDVVEIDFNEMGRSKQISLESNGNVYIYVMKMQLDNGYKMVSVYLHNNDKSDGDEKEYAKVVSLLRLQVETMADNGGASNINDISDEQIKDIKDKILERVKITAPSSYVDTEKEMVYILLFSRFSIFVCRCILWKKRTIYVIRRDNDVNM